MKFKEQQILRREEMEKKLKRFETKKHYNISLPITIYLSMNLERDNEMSKEELIKSIIGDEICDFEILEPLIDIVRDRGEEIMDTFHKTLNGDMEMLQVILFGNDEDGECSFDDGIEIK
jgi:hypothetical protein